MASNYRMINRKRLEGYEQAITTALQPNTTLLLGSKGACEALYTQISNVKAALIDYTRVYDKYLDNIIEEPDLEKRKAMRADAEAAFANMMATVSECLGYGVVMGVQGSIMEGVEELLSSSRAQSKIAYAQQALDELLMEILKACATRGAEGGIIRAALGKVREKAIYASSKYPPVFSLLGLFNNTSEINHEIAGIKEFEELYSELRNSEERIPDESTVADLAKRLEEDMELYEGAASRDVRDYFRGW